MFTKILIANRGEIACRIARSAAKMGVRTVAVYSDADAGSAHVLACDEAVHIGGSLPAESYLLGDRIIAAALERGAEAIHPGYGFLSENPEFVEACEKAGLVFIGPSAKAIRAMGLKDAAKAAMERAGVPVVPGYHGTDQDAGLLAKEAARIGFPVLIKAVAGGGGKGMRRVDRAADFAEALAAAAREGQGAFGNPAVLIEKYIEHPRHIEVQVFGDGKEAVHLFERDCSLQRRHQKVIEEAPAPGMNDNFREAICAAAVRAAKAIGYASAGTIEFIVDGANGLKTDGFWFMEMNTRLQVEHPVTEAITGVDLVEWQLRIAAGEGLPCQQEELSISGHAFEARLYAEDVPKGFLPATGTLDVLEFPAGARIETGVRPKDEISPFYDPMIAKIITHGPTRAIALLQLSKALEGLKIGGSVTNRAFLANLARNEDFAQGRVDTGLIERNLEALCAEAEPDEGAIALAMLAAAGLNHAPKALAGFSLWQPLAHPIEIAYSEEILSGAIAFTGPNTVRITRETGTTVLQWRDGWQCEGAQIHAAQSGAKIYVFGAATWAFEIRDPLARDTAAGAAGNVIEAPMPGLLREIFVRRGDTVAKGARLAILEAMKMEHVLAAPRDGIVAEVLGAPGDQVVAGAPLIALEEETENDE
ncbi:MAG: 3-methylcrotonyl-CoA carboxylase alpha subunit [Halocynthiibacter sp.]|jgi:3-methylcrotonyl-CoA carboxylase alpha subunit